MATRPRRPKRIHVKKRARRGSAMRAKGVTKARTTTIVRT